VGLLDDLKGKAQQVIGGNHEAIKNGIEKAGDFVDSKTGGKHADKIDSVQRGASDFVDKQNYARGRAASGGRTAPRQR
jgi:hypothetical protein